MVEFMTPNMFADKAGISSSVMDHIVMFDALLQKRSGDHNLISRNTMQIRWKRHYLDSAQLFSYFPRTAQTLYDFGSGAGFPGLILAAMGKEQGLKVTLIESTGKKAYFLTEAASAMGLTNVTVVNKRVENINPRQKDPDIITARALKSLTQLCALAAPFMGPSTICLFPKGQRALEELKEAEKSWEMETEFFQSQTNEDARILKITQMKPREGAGK